MLIYSPTAAPRQSGYPTVLAARGGRRPPLDFELRDVLVGIDTIVIYYRSRTRNRTVAERVTLNSQNLAVAAAGIYGEPLEPT